jgi:ABC-type phosphate transport system substrate-binding protein
MRSLTSRAIFAASAVATTLVAVTAHAAPCTNTGLPGTPVFVAGSSAAKPMLKQVSAALAAIPNTPIRLVYQSLGSCAGLSDITTGTKEPATGIVWDGSGTEVTCDAPSGGADVDVAISDVYASTCTNITIPNGQKDFLGSAQVFDFVVPPSSKETVISQEAAFVIYGFGAVTNIVNPWNDVNFIFRRSSSSGTYSMAAKLLGLDIAKFKGTIPGTGKSGDVLTAVHNADATNPDKAIGILSADFADTNRGGPSAIKVLAYQPKGAACGFFPDSSSTTFDKINVREGRYPFWGPLHYVTKVDNQGKPSSQTVATLLSYFTRDGLAVDAKKKMIDAEVAAYTIPQCAMKVSRTAEVGVNDAPTAFTPDDPCGCYYEFKATGTAPKACVTCTDDTPCGTGKCRYGYCEAK